jgi:hypothetical protein
MQQLSAYLVCCCLDLLCRVSPALQALHLSCCTPTGMAVQAAMELAWQQSSSRAWQQQQQAQSYAAAGLRFSRGKRARFLRCLGYVRLMQSAAGAARVLAWLLTSGEPYKQQ